MEYTHICGWCEKTFTSFSKRSQFCCPSCATQHTNRKRMLKHLKEHQQQYIDIAKRQLPKRESFNHYQYCVENVHAYSMNDYVYHENDLHICSTCGKKFITNRQAKYCSNECFIKSKECISRVCINCGMTFNLHEVDRRYKIFCSETCKHDFYTHLSEKSLTAHEQLLCHCVNCGEAFFPISFMTGITFCSHQCERDFNLKKKITTKVCKKCGKTFTTVSKMKFCSRHCASSYTAKQIGLGRIITPHSNGMKHRQHTKYARDKMSESISNAICQGKINIRYTKLVQGYLPFIPHYTRSSWEMNIALILLYLGREYKFEAKTFKLLDGKRYTPDFYDIKRDIFYEVKGRENDIAKITAMKKLYPQVRIHCITHNKYIRICNRFSRKVSLIASNTHGLKKTTNMYSLEEVRRLLISKEEHEAIFGDTQHNRYKNWNVF